MLMSNDSPNVLVIAGPNGSGKSTAAPGLLRDYLGISEFVNANVIAQGLSGFRAENVAVEAGRIMLERLDELGRQGADFAFETTLASRTVARRLRELKTAGYRTHLLFLWPPSPEMAIARVASRVRRGGHHVPDDVVRRRYEAGLRNFFEMYRPIIDAWRMFDNSDRDGYELIAQETSDTGLQVENAAKWETIEEQYQ